MHAAVLVGAAVAGLRPHNGWATATRAGSGAAVDIRLQLKRAAPAALDEAFWRVSDPASPSFRKFLNRQQVAELVRPQAGAVDAALQWAKQIQGSASVSGFGDYVYINAPVSAVEGAFAVELWEHTHRRSNRTVIRTTRDATVTVPSAILEHVEAVHGMTELLPVVGAPSDSGEPGDDIDPDVIAKQYATGHANAPKSSRSQGIAAFEQAQFHQSDVDIFQKHYNIPAVKIQVDGPNDGGYFGEASLDTQYIMSTGRAIGTWFIARDSFDMLAWCQEVLNMTTPPTVLSVSWGSGESGFEADHMKAASAEFQKLGAMGISIFAASGDQGTGSQGFLSCKKFDPTWPALSPYITAVGGTYLSNGKESGWSGSGGGFSATFPAPSYQTSAVAKYIGSATLPSSSLFNAQGRGTPDVSALATNYKVTTGTTEGKLSGTSAATPVFAGLVALLNAGRAAENKAPLGFINPALYASFSKGSGPGYDVVAGNNKHSGCPAGFPAVAGWDAITGLGTPTLAALRTALNA
eukprot:TRINITY_DN317_c0_g1_i1.p1 TRINITY_DN317_c0_g1~~TRINITY_DN317_c0_g1_i1.p1  ORF type:complete len:549 (+),score=150.64 TRINITY_DN317_c0_g1_i1:83-1648(+)